MKKFFFLAVAAIVTLAACTKNDIDETTKEARQINFTAVAGMNTKAAITGTTYKTTDPAFGMFCFALAGNNWDSSSADSQAYMDNETVSYNSTDLIWETATTYYWPLSGTLTFIGYSPKAAAGTVAYNKATRALTVTDFTVNSAAASQQDLMWATTQKNLSNNQSTYTSESATSTKTGVNVIFHHALSQVKFNVKKAAGLDAYTITVNSITFHAKNKGTLTVTNDSPVWSGQAYLSEGAFDFNTTGEDVVAPNNSADFAAFGVANMTVPQTLAASDQTFTIRYSLKKGDVLLGSKEIIKDLYVNAEGLTAWAANTIYNYNIVVDLNKIYFNPTIVDWTTGASQEINVPN